MELTEIVNSFQTLFPSSEITNSSNNKIIIKTDQDRLDVMNIIVSSGRGFRRDTSISGSSIGGVTNGILKVLVKPKSKVKGSGGRAFETEFINEFEKWRQGAKSIYTNHFKNISLSHGISELDLKDYTTIPMGKFNQKRTIDGVLSGVPEKIGEIVTDVTLINSEGNKIFLSLKIGKSYYLYNGGFSKILKSDIERRSLLARMGVDYKRFEEDFNIVNLTDFEPEIEKCTNFFTILCLVV